MSMSNSSAKQNTNVEGKCENKSDIQKESKKSKNFVDSLFSIGKQHSSKTIMAHININSLSIKFDMLTNSVTEYIDTLIISETKVDNGFPHAFYHIKDFKSIWIREKLSWRWSLGLRKG